MAKSNQDMNPMTLKAVPAIINAIKVKVKLDNEALEKLINQVNKNAKINQIEVSTKYPCSVIILIYQYVSEIDILRCHDV